MRLSSDPTDPGYTSECALYDVRFNGVLLHTWITADEERGLVQVRAVSPDGEPKNDYRGQPVLRILHGVVMISGG